MAKMIHIQHLEIVVGIFDYSQVSIIEACYPTLLDGKFPGLKASMVVF
jgi:hypothetical protein